MLKRFINWIAGVKEIEDPDVYPDIYPDMDLEELLRRLNPDDPDWNDEDDTANFEMEVDEDV